MSLTDISQLLSRTNYLMTLCIFMALSFSARQVYAMALSEPQQHQQQVSQVCIMKTIVAVGLIFMCRPKELTVNDLKLNY